MSTYDKYMRYYYHKNRERILAQRRERRRAKRQAEIERARAGAAASLDAILSSLPSNEARAVMDVVARCTPPMLEVLVSRSKAGVLDASA